MMVHARPNMPLGYPIVVPALMFKVLARFWFDTNMSPAAMQLRGRRAGDARGRLGVGYLPFVGIAFKSLKILGKC